MAQKTYFVYLLASKKNGTLYTGVTNNLMRRVYEHKRGFVKGFTSRHGVHMLVYFEQTNDIFAALNREKQIKKWNRKWKIELIDGVNPGWEDLYYAHGGTDEMFDEYFRNQESMDSRFRGNDKEMRE